MRGWFEGLQKLKQANCCAVPQVQKAWVTYHIGRQRTKWYVVMEGVGGRSPISKPTNASASTFFYCGDTGQRAPTGLLMLEASHHVLAKHPLCAPSC